MEKLSTNELIDKIEHNAGTTYDGLINAHLIKKLIDEMKSSSKYTKWILFLTIILVIMTLIILIK